MATLHKVFEENILADIKLKNRIVRSATNEGMADENGYPTDKLTNKYVQLAKGGVGLIITGNVAFREDGAGSFRMAKIYNDEVIEPFKKMVEEVHKNDSKIVMQITHAGRQIRSKNKSFDVIAVSPIKNKMFNDTTPKEISNDDIQILIEDFISAIERIKKADFDGVQLHIAHGYLLSEFLSPRANKRNDEWGGSLENRYKIIDRIIVGARKLVGNFPILVKLNAYDLQKEGMKIDEATKIAKMLEKSGCDAIEVSCGTTEDGLSVMRGETLPVDPLFEFNFKKNKIMQLFKPIVKPLIKKIAKMPKPIVCYNLSEALEIKKNVNIPVISVGGISNIEQITDIIENKNIDYVSMSRPFIIEPNIVNKFKEKKQIESKCLMCNYCIIVGAYQPMKCYYGKSPKK